MTSALKTSLIKTDDAEVYAFPSHGIEERILKMLRNPSYRHDKGISFVLNINGGGSKQEALRYLIGHLVRKNLKGALDFVYLAQEKIPKHANAIADYFAHEAVERYWQGE